MNNSTKRYLAFYIGATRENPSVRFWDTVICFVDGSPYSHVEYAVDKEDGTFDCYSSSARDGGVRFKNMELKENHWELIPIFDSFSHDYAMKVFEAHKGQKYDYLGLCTTKYYWMANIPNRWFCSEIVVAMLGLTDYSNYGLCRLYNEFKEVGND